MKDAKVVKVDKSDDEQRLIQASLSIAFTILTEASLSFLGLGVRPPEPSRSGMIAVAASPGWVYSEEVQPSGRSREAFRCP